MIFRLTWPLPLIIVLIASCKGLTEQQQLHAQQLDSLDRQLEFASAQLALDPDLLQKRVDSMNIKVEWMMRAHPQQRGLTEFQASKSLQYQSALKIYEEYLNQHDELAYDIEAYHKEIAGLRKGIADGKAGVGTQIGDAKTKVDELARQVKALAQRIIGVSPQFKRAERVVNKLYYNTHK